jgi:hypothetical protein
VWFLWPRQRGQGLRGGRGRRTMRCGVIPKRGFSMETIAGFGSAVARGLRGLFDLASMAVGVAPSPSPLASGAGPGLAEVPRPENNPVPDIEAEKFSKTFHDAMFLTDRDLF